VGLFVRLVLAFVLVALFAAGLSGWLGEQAARGNIQRFAVEQGWITAPLNNQPIQPNQPNQPFQNQPNQPDQSFQNQPNQPNRPPPLLAPPRPPPPRDLERLLANLRLSQLGATAIALVVALLAGGYLALRLVQPIRELTRINQRYTLGERQARFVVRGQDEINRLGATFNRLADQLGAEQRRQKQLVADVAHELRTPLTVLRGELEYLQDGLSQATPETLRRLADEVDLLTRLVTDLRLVSLADSGGLTLTRTRLDLHQLAGEALAAFGRQAEANGQRLVLSGQPLWLDLDRERLRQVLYNLLDNALRHSPAGGGQVCCSVRAEGAWVLLEVSDEGTGIAATELERVFERLYRSDQARNRAEGGSGLGLAIVRTLVTAHGGSVSAANRGGGAGGAVFTVRLPKAGVGKIGKG
jgi:two-component system, OmpR family, sensor histidine kinase BaeS